METELNGLKSLVSPSLANPAGCRGSLSGGACRGRLDLLPELLKSRLQLLLRDGRIGIGEGVLDATELAVDLVRCELDQLVEHLQTA